MQLSDPISADKNQWFQNVHWLFLTNISHFGSHRNNIKKFRSFESKENIIRKKGHSMVSADRIQLRFVLRWSLG